MLGLYLTAKFVLMGIFNFIDMEFAVTRVVVVSMVLTIAILYVWGVAGYLILDTSYCLVIAHVNTGSFLVLVALYYFWWRHRYPSFVLRLSYEVTMVVTYAVWLTLLGCLTLALVQGFTGGGNAQYYALYTSFSVLFACALFRYLHYVSFGFRIFVRGTRASSSAITEKSHRARFSRYSATTPTRRPWFPRTTSAQT